MTNAAFDYNFAVCIFPAVYWHACRHWPLQKTLIPYARRGEPAQRRLHAAIQGGLSLEDFDCYLIGQGPIGAEITATPPARPSPEDLPPRGFTDEDWVKLIYRRSGGTMLPELPRPPQDAVFDHLDRCEFLERFPLMKIDRAGFADLARSLNLPSWRTWVETARALQIGDDRPPCNPERFAQVVSGVRIAGDMSDDRPHTLDSHAARVFSQLTAEAAARLLGRGDWPRFIQAAEILELPGAWRRVARAISDRATPPST